MTKSLEKILYVEDEGDIQDVARLSLEDVGGFILNVCDSGEAALKVAQEFEPDLLLLDVMMPGMDGPATLSALRKVPGIEHTPAIFMTAKVMKSEIERYKEMGALDVISKPFDPMTLSEQIRDIWKRYHE
jgi:CheY-like chemotaxis protein